MMEVDSFHLEFSTRLCYDMNESFAEEMEICVTEERIECRAYGFNVGKCMQCQFQTVPRNFAFGFFDNEMLSTSEVHVEDSMMDISYEIQSHNGFGYNQAQHVWLHNTNIFRELETPVPMDIDEVVIQSDAAVDIKLAECSSEVTEACVSSFNQENSAKTVVVQLSELKTDNHTELSLDCCTQLQGCTSDKTKASVKPSDDYEFTGNRKRKSPACTVQIDDKTNLPTFKSSPNKRRREYQDDTACYVPKTGSKRRREE